ncbi:hypothetical protein CR105_03120 [Massilia eurypsychrophila]|uniref:Uncharacterized protein n=1 Tax=Massilia eurypsychrophila TaxID=1485217 RepID=A0A2G8TJ78_9BURK|nr:hypothetical protein CR105_03120 [Massilia eurypsychrophila]
MYSHIKRLRVRGERRPDREISADPGAVGNLTVFRQGAEIVAAFHAGGGTGQPGELLPALFRARLVTMHGQGMLFQGWERPLGHDQKDTESNKQEWSVRLMAAPPEVAPPSQRLG